MLKSIPARIADELSVREAQVAAAIQLLDEGATVPFIARYRKEVTGGLDDIQLRELEARLGYLRELRDRLQTVIKAIDEQGKLTPVLLAAYAALPMLLSLVNTPARRGPVDNPLPITELQTVMNAMLVNGHTTEDPNCF